jgi:hypothetical protein
VRDGCTNEDTLLLCGYTSVWCRILTALVAMNEAPFIRYEGGTHDMAKRVADRLYKQLKTYRDVNPSWAPFGHVRDEDFVLGSRDTTRQDDPREPATVIIVDRTQDLSPLLFHDTAYTVRMGAQSLLRGHRFVFNN